MKLRSRRIITGDKPNPDKPEPRNVCHQGTKARKIFIVLFFLSGEKKFCHKKHQNKYEVTAK
ncbi:MAG TPA: hypothetical protein VMW06_05255 [Desulfobacterales bacterium]|nr:hypothetical protein [Desulfobacterales bacterium]